MTPLPSSPPTTTIHLINTPRAPPPIQPRLQPLRRAPTTPRRHRTLTPPHLPPLILITPHPLTRQRPHIQSRILPLAGHTAGGSGGGHARSNPARRPPSQTPLHPPTPRITPPNIAQPPSPTRPPHTPPLTSIAPQTPHRPARIIRHLLLPLVPLLRPWVRTQPFGEGALFLGVVGAEDAGDVGGGGVGEGGVVFRGGGGEDVAAEGVVAGGCGG